jgi:large subunit ribosomal protein L9
VRVIFISDVPNVAKAGDIKEVPSGYGRNYLIPKKLAVVADSTTSMIHAQSKIKESREAAAKLGELTALAKELDGKEITIKARAGKEKLFGSITSADISTELQNAFGLNVDKNVDKKKIDLAEPIHHLGSYDIIVRLTGELSANIKVNVVEETENSAQ